MYFYIDESGNTGNNLFDKQQPNLYYGVLSSKHDLDVEAATLVTEARKKLQVERLHASALGLEKLSLIAQELGVAQVELGLVFDLYGVRKMDLAAVNFFDQVFDPNLNPSVPRSSYFTPLRYVLLHKLAALFDIDTLAAAWQARISCDATKSQKNLVMICGGLRKRLHILPDKRSQEVIGNALAWAEEHPAALRYNCTTPDDSRFISPNVVGFQFVMHGIAARSEDAGSAARIVVDQQTEFNATQRVLSEYYAARRGAKLKLGIGIPEMDLSKIPTAPLEFRSSKSSPGLELVDIYLWLMKRVRNNAPVAAALKPLVAAQIEFARYDELSLEGLAKRWAPFLEALPLLNEEQLSQAKELMRTEEENRQAAMRDFEPD